MRPGVHFARHDPQPNTPVQGSHRAASEAITLPNASIKLPGLVADGLGAYIAQVTEQNNKPALYFAVLVMSVFVVCINRFLWRRLYDLAERRFTLA